MSTKTAILACLATLLALAPLAAAEWYEGKPDCPPDTFCTTSAPSEDDAPADRGACMEAYCRTALPDGDDDPAQAPEGSEGDLASVAEESAKPVPLSGAVAAVAGLGAAAAFVARRR